MTGKEKWQAEFNSMKPSDKAIVANFFHMCSLYPAFERAFDTWNESGGGFTIDQFFDFIDNFEANASGCGFGGQSLLN